MCPVQLLLGPVFSLRALVLNGVGILEENTTTRLTTLRGFEYANAAMIKRQVLGTLLSL